MLAPVFAGVEPVDEGDGVDPRHLEGEEVCCGVGRCCGG